MRMLVGSSLHLGLPLYGHADEDDRAGYVFTDARIRDDQAWNLASSDRPILDAVQPQILLRPVRRSAGVQRLRLPLSLARCPASAVAHSALGAGRGAGSPVLVDGGAAGLR
ncbi:MAG: hypothetical protein M0C28_33850 [Candidatus Moduliflexus flocculans]|nr:hypothetical protein [Candidatus Moduliflexus flocculans]